MAKRELKRQNESQNGKTKVEMAKLRRRRRRRLSLIHLLPGTFIEFRNSVFKQPKMAAFKHFNSQVLRFNTTNIITILKPFSIE